MADLEESLTSLLEDSQDEEGLGISTNRSTAGQAG